jgi:hypothetical protein
LILIWVFAIRAKIKQANEDEDEDMVPPAPVMTPPSTPTA